MRKTDLNLDRLETPLRRARFLNTFVSKMINFPEETTQHTVTATEIFCNTTNGWYFNGSCLAVNGNGLGNESSACTSGSSVSAGLASHLAHLDSNTKRIIARALGRVC